MSSNNIRNSIMALLLFSAVVSCKKDNSTGNTGTSLNAQTMLNVSYGTDALQDMDIYLPAGRDASTTKVMVMIHGGAWNSGDKSDFNAFVDTMRRRLPDYAIFNINYRLSAAPVNLFPTQELDVKAAIEFINSKSADYHISGKYVLIGASAGGHLAMLQGFKYGSPVKAKAIVSFYGPSDLIQMYNNPVGGVTLISAALAQAIGKTPAQDPQLYIDSSPVTFITASSPPTILLHGGMDQLVNPSQSIEVRDKLQIAGVNTQYIFYPSAAHDIWTDAIFYDAFNNIQNFLSLNVN